MKKNNGNSLGVIYTVKCEISGEMYVGATTDSVQQRKLDHNNRAMRGENHPFAQAIATYGANAFTWNQTDTASSIDELAKKEVETIKKLKENHKLYNADRGGGFKKTIYQYSKNDGSLIASYDSLEEAAKSVNASNTSISNACLGYNKSCLGYFWSYNLYNTYKGEDRRLKKVQQFAIPSGLLLNTFNSVAEASRQTGVSKTCISRVCRGEREKSGGFLWKYKS
ncbi:NUMOD1 domain-containing DNA-binding protein [Pseudotamlana carrageenivorans]|uniref:Endonuclease n=1 Tax=Pseudotamlana carrageenivorans TaxID=2069432 RepID=A0A2I7SGT9_9FLAO|nr:NUMOD1 domain-containing DNA-binding protein [Tamlana carrageenivorans]AUS05117.1 endonuclease [Tamlana carrageenivorans]